MKKNIKLIALDLDGTLLNSEKKVSERTVEVLKRCEAQGIWIVPTTGRAKEAVPEFILKLPGVHYGIFVNGASIWNLEKQEEIVRDCIDWKTAQETARILCHYPILYDFYIDGTGICEERFLNCLEQFGLPEYYCRFIRETRTATEDLFEYLETTHASVQKMNLLFSMDGKKVKETVREVLAKLPGILVTSSFPWNLEVNAAGVVKGKGIRHLAEYLGLPMEQTMACGDGENDLSMVRAAGFGVAMKNAAPFLKEQADWITLSNDEDGVAEAIERWVLE